MKLLTRTEELILWAILRLKDNAYCVPIRDRVTEVTGEEWPPGLDLHAPGPPGEERISHLAPVGVHAGTGGQAQTHLPTDARGFRGT